MLKPQFCFNPSIYWSKFANQVQFHSILGAHLLADVNTYITLMRIMYLNRPYMVYRLYIRIGITLSSARDMLATEDLINLASIIATGPYKFVSLAS